MANSLRSLLVCFLFLFALELTTLFLVFDMFSRRFMQSAIVEKFKTNKEAQSSMRQSLAKRNKNIWQKIRSTLIPTDFFTRLFSSTLNDDQFGKVVAVATWRFWKHEFALGLIFLISSVAPLVTWVAERRGLEKWQKPHIWALCAIDVMLVELAAIFLLAWRFLGAFGFQISEHIDGMITEFTRSLASLDGPQQELLEHALHNLASDFQWRAAKNWKDWADRQILAMMNSLKEPLEVGLMSFLPFFLAALLFFCTSTIFVAKCKRTTELPWMTRWNAAIGGPLFLLGAARSSEVQQQCHGIMLQILFRGLLLSILLAAFLAPVDDFDTGIVTALLLNREMTRVPFVISWFGLWALHIMTGVMAVKEIKSLQTPRDKKRLARDIDRQIYGTFTPAARAEEGHGAEAESNPLPAGQPGVDHLPGKGQSPGPLKSQTFGER